IDPELLAHTAERSRPRRWIPSRVHGHPRGPLPKLIGVLPRCSHAPHPPVGSEPPPDPGRFNASTSSRNSPRLVAFSFTPYSLEGIDRRIRSAQISHVRRP